MFRKEKKVDLKDIREKAKLTQAQISKLTGLSIRYISLIETGKRTPSDKSKEKLAKAYRVPEVEIFLASQRTKRSSSARL